MEYFYRNTYAMHFALGMNIRTNTPGAKTSNLAAGHQGMMNQAK